MLLYVEECRNHYKDLVKLARKQGFTELQLMHAAVDACSCSSTPAAPAALDDDAARLKLLVSTQYPVVASSCLPCMVACSLHAAAQGLPPPASLHACSALSCMSACCVQSAGSHLSHLRDIMSLAQHAQVDYVRDEKQLRALQHLHSNATAFSVALPGSEGRTLHARGRDTTRQQKLQQKLGALMTKLNITEPLDRSSDEYRAGLAALRDEQLQSLQAEIEKLVSALSVLTYARQQQGAASSITRSQKKQAQSRRTRVRQLVGVMHSWQTEDAPSSSAVEQLPAAWTEAEVTKLFKGEYPWRCGSGGSGAAVAAMLAERFRDACAEVRRQSSMRIVVCSKGSVLL